MVSIWQRRLYAAVLVALPLLSIAEERLTYTAQGGAHQPDAAVGTAQMLAPITAHHGLWLAAACCAVTFAVLQLFGVLALLRLARDRGRRLAVVGAVLSLTGGLLYAMDVATWNLLIGAMATSDAAPTELAKLAQRIESYPPFLLVFGNAYLLNLGMLLIVAAIWRSRTVARWAVICLAVFPINELLSIGEGPVYILASTVWLVGLTAAAATLLRSQPTPEQPASQAQSDTSTAAIA